MSVWVVMMPIRDSVKRGTMREMLPSREVERRAMMALPPLVSWVMRLKWGWPRVPRCPPRSPRETQDCPVRSISTAPLMATKGSFERMVWGSPTLASEAMVIPVLPSMNLKSLSVPMHSDVVTVFPSGISPPRMRSMTVSVMISE